MCTRALYSGNDNTVMTGRNTDWNEGLASNLWVFPAGIQRDGAAGTVMTNSPTYDEQLALNEYWRRRLGLSKRAKVQALTNGGQSQISLY